MTHYAIGDVQGCYDPLMRLLEQIQFDPANDVLWFTGDIVNRGPQSLEVLRFVKSLGNRQVTVLGNHDLHLLALWMNAVPRKEKDSFLLSVLNAKDCDELLLWLRMQPLLHHELDYTLVHAGLFVSWDLQTAQRLAHEVETVLRSEDASHYLQHMYGNFPDFWNESLTGYERLRCITNIFTRMRFCFPDGRLQLSSKGSLEQHQSENLIPWFRVPNRRNTDLKIIFGHWAALMGVTDVPNVFALDTGCVWGNSLTALQLHNEKRFNVNCTLEGFVEKK